MSNRDFVIGPVDDDLIRNHFSEEFTRLPWDSTIEDVLVAAGVFSKTQARKNGFFGPVPEGINMIGPKKKGIWVWKDTVDHEHRVWWEKFFSNQV